MDSLFVFKRFSASSYSMCTYQRFMRRQMSLMEKTKSRFYKNVTVESSEDTSQCIVCLDSRKLKTPLGNTFKVPSKPLALAVAGEWYSQGQIIANHYMPLTNLCNTCLDNPSNSSVEDLKKGILSFLNTDTLCFRVDEPEDLAVFQADNWDPVISWFQKRYNVKIKTSTDFMLQPQSIATMETLTSELSKLTKWQLFALESATISLKSCMLSLATLEGHLDVEEAVYLSQLEQEFQITKWGRVEWSHDVDSTNQKSQVAAAAIVFNELNCE